MRRNRHIGSVFLCLGMADHHIKPASATINLVRKSSNPEEDIDYRNNLIREELAIATAQLELIGSIAENNGYEDILTVLREQFEYGHDFTQGKLKVYKSKRWDEYSSRRVGEPFGNDVPPEREFPCHFVGRFFDLMMRDGSKKRARVDLSHQYRPGEGMRWIDFIDQVVPIESVIAWRTTDYDNRYWNRW